MRSYFRPSSPAAVSPSFLLFFYLPRRRRWRRPQEVFFFSSFPAAGQQQQRWPLYYSWDYWKWAANGLQPFLYDVLASTVELPTYKKRKRERKKRTSIIISCVRHTWGASVRKWGKKKEPNSKLGKICGTCGFPFIFLSFFLVWLLKYRGGN